MNQTDVSNNLEQAASKSESYAYAAGPFYYNRSELRRRWKKVMKSMSFQQFIRSVWVSHPC